MQLLSADATIFKKKLTFFAPENMKKLLSKVGHNLPPVFFKYCQPAYKQPKSQIFFIEIFHRATSL